MTVRRELYERARANRTFSVGEFTADHQDVFAPSIVFTTRSHSLPGRHVQASNDSRWIMSEQLLASGDIR